VYYFTGNIVSGSKIVKTRLYFQILGLLFFPIRLQWRMGGVGKKDRGEDGHKGWGRRWIDMKEDRKGVERDGGGRMKGGKRKGETEEKAESFITDEP